MFRIVRPHLRIESVFDLDIPRLRSLDLESLLLDVDCTLKEYRSPRLPPESLAWLAQLREAGIGLCLVSNGRQRRIATVAAPTGLPFVHKALKPLPFRCTQAIRQHGFDPRRTAMVGDQIFADVMAGRLAGIRTILVRPIHPEEEPWFTRLKRPFERMLLRHWDRSESPVGVRPEL